MKFVAKGEMARMLDVLVTCMVILHVTWAYVDLPAELPPHMGPPPSECRDLMDLYIVIDGSDSISYKDFETLKKAIASLIPQIRLGERQARIGMLVYSSHVPTDSEHPFSPDKNYCQQSALTLSHPRDGTNTALGIKHMRHMFKKYGRPNVPWVALVITDGISKDQEATALEARMAKEMGISMFAVGITQKINLAELTAIADTDKQVIQLELFSELQRKLSSMMKTICPCQTPPVVHLAECGSGPRAIGSVRTYKCISGYHQRGAGDIVCRDDSTWSPLDPTFDCVPCGPTPTIDFAYCGGDNNLIGARRTYVCDQGYALIGNPDIECLPGASWSKPQFKCSPCGRTPGVPHAECDGGGSLIGHRRKYTCDPRYALIGDPFIECQPDGQWSIPNFSCSVCGDTPPIQYGSCGGGNNFVGTIRQYQCEPGYALIGNPNIECLSTGQWSEVQVACSLCGKTPPIQHGLCDSGDHFVGTRRQYQCEAGYALIGNPYIECLPTGQWSQTDVACSLCGNTPPLEHGSCGVGDHFVGTRRQYECEAGYALVGNPYIECLPSGQWSRVDVVCSLCGNTPPLQHGSCGVGDHFVGTRRQYECEAGYALIGNPYIECLPTGQWSKVDVACSLCGNIPPIKHGSCGVGDHFVGTRRQYQCETGYALIGNPNIECLPTGQWSKVDVACSLCGNTPPVHHGSSGGGDHFVGTRRQYECEAGYALIGNPYIECLPSGLWSKVQVTCSLCGNTPPIQHGSCGVGDHFVGTRRQYECEAGYALVGNPYIECLPTGQWSQVDVECSLCGNTPPLQYGSCGGGDHFVGTRGQCECEAGYALIGNPYIECLPTGQWSKVDVVCSLCGNIPPLQHGSYGGGDHFVGTRRQYECEAGYALIGNPYIECLPSGQWSQVDVVCSLCGNTPPIQHGSCDVGDHFVGTRRQYHCKAGYALIGNPYIECLPTGQWSKVDVACSLCGNTPPIKHGSCDIGDSFVGTRRQCQCETGYALIGNPYIECLPTGQWSELQVACSLCGNTPPIQHGSCGGGDHFVGSVRKYECDAGYGIVGDPYIECLSTGEWSNAQASCNRMCNDPPVIQNAVCGTGGHFFGDRRKYNCMEGFTAYGHVEIECLSDGSWSHTDLICKVAECGKPPYVANAYPKLGPHRVGSRKEYYCDIGFRMRGSSQIMCLQDGHWEKPNFSCEIITTPKPTTPPTRPTDPSVCDRCKYDNGVGYNNHPYDCNQYIQCYIGRSGLEPIYRRCPFGLFWDQSVLTCRESHLVDCPHDRCALGGIRGYKLDTDPTNCCSYWKCDKGKSVGDCCGKGMSFNPTTGVCELDNFCTSTCLYEEYIPGCDKRPTLKDTLYEVHVGRGHWIEMPCAPGTAFNPVDCKCSLTLMTIPGKRSQQVCKPTVYLPFHKDFQDNSGQHTYVKNENASIINGAAYFDGNARLMIPQFTNRDFRGHLVIKFKYSEVIDPYTEDQLQSLVSNGDCGTDPSIVIAKLPQYVIMGAKTDRSRSMGVATMNKVWKEVIYIHDEQNLEGRVCGAGKYISSWGPIQSTPCSLQIGYGQGLHKFVGFIDDFFIYQCRPRHLSTSY